MAQTLQQLSQSIILNNNFHHGNINCANNAAAINDNNINNNNMNSLSAFVSNSAYAMYPQTAPSLAHPPAHSEPPIAPPPSLPQNISFPTYIQYNNNHMNTSNQSLMLDQASSGTERISSSFISNYYSNNTANTSTASTPSILQPTTVMNSNNNNMMMMNRTLNEREQFFCFVKILFKLLQEPSHNNNNNDTTRERQRLLQRCKLIVRDCTFRNRRGDSDCQPLVECSRRRLRPVIGEEYWRHAEIVWRRSLALKAEREQQQQQQLEQPADPAQTIIPTAV